jgi:hypothetical protein
MSKKPVSITRKHFLDDLVTKPSAVEVNGMTMYVKPISEVKRSSRAASAMDDEGNFKREYLERRRVYAIIDHVCDEDGNPLFTEKDIKQLLQLDSNKLDAFYVAVAQFAEEGMGNE